MAFDIRVDQSGDVKKGQSLIGFATGQLFFIFNNIWNYSADLKEIFRSWVLSDGSTIEIYGNKWGLEPYYRFDISSPLVVSVTEEGGKTYYYLLLINTYATDPILVLTFSDDLEEIRGVSPDLFIPNIYLDGGWSTIATIQPNNLNTKHHVARPFREGNYDLIKGVIQYGVGSVIVDGDAIPIGFPNAYIPEAFGVSTPYIYRDYSTFDATVPTGTNPYTGGRRPFYDQDGNLSQRDLCVFRKFTGWQDGDEISGWTHPTYDQWIRYKTAFNYNSDGDYNNKSWIDGAALDSNGSGYSTITRTLEIYGERVIHYSLIDPETGYMGYSYNDAMPEWHYTDTSDSWTIPTEHLALLGNTETLNYTINTSSNLEDVTCGSYNYKSQQWNPSGGVEGDYHTWTYVTENRGYFMNRQTLQNNQEYLKAGSEIIDTFNWGSEDHSWLGINYTDEINTEELLHGSYIPYHTETTESDYPDCYRKNSSEQSGHRYTGVLDYDAIHNGATFIAGYEYDDFFYHHETTWPKDQDPSWYTSLYTNPKDKIVYRIAGGPFQYITIDVDSSTRYYAGPTDSGTYTYSGRRLRHFSCQANDKFLLYTYNIEVFNPDYHLVYDPYLGFDVLNMWLFDEKIIGIINIKKTDALEVGYTKEWSFTEANFRDYVSEELYPIWDLKEFAGIGLASLEN